MRIDPSLYKNDDVDNSLPDHNVPPVVLAALVVFSLLFLAGGVYLFVSGPFTGIDIIEPAQLPPVYIAVKHYEGPVWGMEKERRRIAGEIKQQGLAVEEPISVYEKSPMKMRPLKVNAEIGFILSLGFSADSNSPGLIIKKIEPGRRLIVRVNGKGNFSGNKAYKAANKFLKSKGLSTVEGERYEIKKYDQRKGNQIEHWIPVH